MKPTNDKFFVDSNVFIYLFDQNLNKKEIALRLLKAKPVISTQVVSENINVLFKKFPSLTAENIRQHKDILISTAKRVEPITSQTLEKAFDLKIQYRLQWYDCLIIAAALLSDCEILYSEDLQHKQEFEGCLTVINPFLNT
jgi:predicted nucleic acid-binding protein